MKNIVEVFEKVARERKSQEAVVFFDKKQNRYRSLRFSGLLVLVNSYAKELEKKGITSSMRVVIGIKPSLNFIIYTFALLKIGATVVFIDSGMAKKNILRCIKNVKPHALVGGKKFLFICRFFCKVKASLRIEPFKIKQQSQRQTTKVDNNHLAAIIFTSGSTGTAKGVEYTHSTFINQVSIIQEIYQVSSKDKDLSIFPLFSLIALSMGMTTVIPDVDMAHPVKIPCEKVHKLICEQRVTFSFGSPTFWRNMANFCQDNKKNLSSIRAIIMAGCSVPIELHKKLLPLLGENACCYVPYGATEALPITNFSSQEIGEKEQLTNAGAGTCVGKVTTNKFSIKIIEVTAEPIPFWQDSLELPQGQVGEICVKGATVTKHYFQNKLADKMAKIIEGEEVWHRMGDVGYFDKEGYLWFCGRKADIVYSKGEALYTDKCENIFNALAGVKRSALVQSAKNKVVLFIETEENKSQLKKSLMQSIVQYKLDEKIEEIIFYNKFPVDVRHNAKIKRDILAQKI